MIEAPVELTNHVTFMLQITNVSDLKHSLHY
jgi:hypothetical protein